MTLSRPHAPVVHQNQEHQAIVRTISGDRMGKKGLRGVEGHNHVVPHLAKERGFENGRASDDLLGQCTEKHDQAGPAHRKGPPGFLHHVV